MNGTCTALAQHRCPVTVYDGAAVGADGHAQPRPGSAGQGEEKVRVRSPVCPQLGGETEKARGEQLEKRCLLSWALSSVGGQMMR